MGLKFVFHKGNDLTEKMNPNNSSPKKTNNSEIDYNDTDNDTGNDSSENLKNTNNLRLRQNLVVKSDSDLIDPNENDNENEENDIERNLTVEKILESQMSNTASSTSSLN